MAVGVQKERRTTRKTPQYPRSHHYPEVPQDLESPQPQIIRNTRDKVHYGHVPGYPGGPAPFDPHSANLGPAQYGMRINGRQLAGGVPYRRAEPESEGHSSRSRR